jgi:hypothetical protein
MAPVAESALPVFTPLLPHPVVVINRSDAVRLKKIDNVFILSYD